MLFLKINAKIIIIIFDIKMMLIEAINQSFLLNSSQKIYLLEKVEKSDEIYKAKLLDSLKSEKDFMLQLLRKYKQDTNSTSIWQLKWELIHKNFNKIKELEEADKDELSDLEQKLEL